MNDDNPFDELGVDPSLSAEELTEEMKRRAERLPPEERKELQSMWRELTMRERDRVRWALLAHPRPEEASAASIEELCERLPPRIDRRELPELRASVRDAMLPVGDEPEVEPVEATAEFGAIAREGQS